MIGLLLFQVIGLAVIDLYFFVKMNGFGQM